MAMHAIYPFHNVRTMIKISVIGNFMNSLPWNRFALVVIFNKFLNLGSIATNNRVAIHAYRRGGNSGMTRLVNSGMAIFAINFQLPCMQCVRILDRLLRFVSNAFSLGFRNYKYQAKRNNNHGNCNWNSNFENSVEIMFFHFSPIIC